MPLEFLMIRTMQSGLPYPLLNLGAKAGGRTTYGCANAFDVLLVCSFQGPTEAILGAR